MSALMVAMSFVTWLAGVGNERLLQLHHGEKRARDAAQPDHEVNHGGDVPGPVLHHAGTSCYVSDEAPGPGCFRLSCVTKPPPRE